MVFPWGVVQLGWANLALSPSPLQILIEISGLILWNEVHFYINHRLLHTPWLKRFHLPHHRSIVTTPWATYSFHPIEAMLLGNVILLPMLVHDFSVIALMSLPIISLIFNNLGHANYDFSPKSQSIFHGASRRHHLHHTCFNGNYGFVLPYIDRWLNTALAADATNAQLSKWQERQN
jgi:sterol desaturase/sphingolipid hydroxylase (fatty acid hydroxylase superfamily)